MSSIKQLHKQAQSLLGQGQYQQAWQCLATILQQDPQHVDANFLMGIVYLETGQLIQAIELIERAISFEKSAEYLAWLTKAYALQGDLLSTKSTADQLSVGMLKSAATLDTVGVALSRVGLHEEAIKYFNKAIATDKTKPHFFYNYAVSHKFLGNFNEAREGFEQAISLYPGYSQAHFALADLGGIREDNNHIARLKEGLEQAQHPDAILHFSHAIAKEFEALGQFSSAFEALTNGKQSKLNTLNYAIEDDIALFTELRTQLYNQSSQKSGCQSDEPIFVLGMPRSGTTLVERIISCHSDVTSAGELQDFGVAVKALAGTESPKVLDIETLQKAQTLDPKQLGEEYLARTRSITGKTPRFIDKLPFNFFYLPLIRRALPNAKIICLLRNPMDTCIGNFRQLFSINSPYYFYAYNLTTVGQFYSHFYHWVHQWHFQDPDNFLLLNYESLVNNPETQIHSLIEFCGLEWQDACLHAERNTAPVSTASKVQVREPINNRSIGRWKKYETQSQELVKILKHQGIPLTN